MGVEGHAPTVLPPPLPGLTRYHLCRILVGWSGRMRNNLASHRDWIPHRPYRSESVYELRSAGILATKVGRKIRLRLMFLYTLSPVIEEQFRCCPNTSTQSAPLVTHWIFCSLLKSGSLMVSHRAALIIKYIMYVHSQTQQRISALLATHFGHHQANIVQKFKKGFKKVTHCMQPFFFLNFCAILA